MLALLMSLINPLAKVTTELIFAKTRWIRPLFALPFIIYNLKVVVWDKVLGLGTTDVLSDQYWQLQMIVFGAYFITRGLGKK